MGSRIPVTVVTGFLGSGKTTLLNHILTQQNDARLARQIALIINEVGSVGIDHERVRHISDNVKLLESGCVCCSVRGDLVEALRELFLSALHKEIPPFSRIVLETTGLADPASVMHTLKYESFLRDRYVYAGCITVVDCVYGTEALQRYPQALQQIVQADVVVLGKVDLASSRARHELADGVRALNGQTQIFDRYSLPRPDDLWAAATVGATIGRSAGRLFAQGALGSGGLVSRRFAHKGVQVVTLRLMPDISRAAFSRAMGRIYELPEIDLLRVKGLLRFAGDEHPSAVHGVHRQLYPIEQLASSAEAHADALDSVLVLIVAGEGASEFQKNVDCILKDEGIQWAQPL